MNRARDHKSDSSLAACPMLPLPPVLFLPRSYFSATLSCWSPPSADHVTSPPATNINSLLLRFNHVTLPSFPPVDLSPLLSPDVLTV